MKNFKRMIFLLALIVASNACAAVTVLQKKIAAAVDKISKNPNVELTADEKLFLGKHLNDNDANITRLKSIEGFDINQLTQISDATVEQQAPEIIDVQKKVVPAKPLTAAQRAAARREAAAAQKKTTARKKVMAEKVQVPEQKVVPAKPLTASQRAAARREAAAAKKTQPSIETTADKPLTAAQKRATARKEVMVEKVQVPEQKVVPAKPLTAAQRAAARREAAAAKKTQVPVQKMPSVKEEAPVKRTAPVRKVVPPVQKEAPARRVAPVKKAPVRTATKEAPIKSSVKPSEDLVEAQKVRVCNNLILLFDSHLAEKPDGKRFAICGKLIAGLQEKVSPIIVARNVAENFCLWKTEHKQMLESVNHELLKTKSIEKARKKSQELLAQLPKERRFDHFNGDLALMLSGTELSDNDWDCYMHKQADLILLVPKKYSARRILGINAETNNFMEACGFTDASLNKIDNLSPESLLQQIQTKRIKKSMNIPDAVKSMFIIKKPSDETEIASWDIYANGHGSVANEIISNKGIVSPASIVAGVDFADFSHLMNIFNEYIETNFVQYSTCFGGGYNQTFVNDVLQKLSVNFIVVAEGINESMVYGRILTTLGNKIEYNRFTNFFGLLEKFFGDSTKVTGVKVPQGWQKDPIASIVGSITELSKIESLPFVRIPSAGVFTALNVDKKVKILTNAIVKAYELEGRTIDMTTSGIENIIVYPSYIGIPTKISHQNFISPTPQKIEQLYKTTHIFEEIITNSRLCDLIPQFVKLNSSYSTITFVIKKLTCSNYVNSGLDNKKTDLAIENMIIQITGTLSASRMSTDADIRVAFMLDGQTYSVMQRINSLAQSGKELVDIFRSLPLSIAQGDLVGRFLKPQESAMLRERSVSGMVEYFESKINKTFGVQKIGALKKVLLMKELEGLEKATEPETLQAQKEWLEQNKKPGVTFATSLDRHRKELARLKADFGKLMEMDQEERNNVQSRIEDIELRIKK